MEGHEGRDMTKNLRNNTSALGSLGTRTNKVRSESSQDSEDYDLEGYLQGMTVQEGVVVIHCWVDIVPPALKCRTTTRSPENQRHID